MQNIITYALANSTLGQVRDYANARNLNAPIFTRGFSVTLKLRLFIEADSLTQYPLASLSSIETWQCVWDFDYDQTTAPVLVADNSDILAHSVTDTIGGVEYTFTEIVIPISDMDTERLATALGNKKSVSGLNMEIVGFDSNNDAIFGLQIENFTVRNRIYRGTV